jgi:YidC/Oxa1 family membrane protein insertase
VSNPLNPLYDAVAWVMGQIHAVLSHIMPPTSGQAWALTIVVLVVLMRLILVPLFVKQMHAMRKMSALAPQLQELRKKYKNDKQTLNEETMRVYKEAGVNPLGGCLPLLAQMPLFFALFSVLRAIADAKPGQGAYGLSPAVVHSAQNANILGAKISDKVLFTGTLHVPLEAKIVILCAVAISVTTTFLTVRQSTKRGMTPQMTPDNPMAASQKYMAYIVPFFALSGLYWPFGLVLYWVTTNVWTLGQQYVLFKRYPPTAPDAAGATGGASSAAASARPAMSAGLQAGGKQAVPGKRPMPAKPAAKSSAAAGKPATAGKQSAAKPGAPARPGASAKPGAPAKPAATAGQPQGKAKPSSQAQAKKASAGSTARSSPAQAPAQGTSANGSGSVSGILRRIGKGRTETEEAPPPAPEPKVIRQQPIRQPRSKRSGKR